MRFSRLPLVVLLLQHVGFIFAQTSEEYITAVIDGQTVSWLYTGIGASLTPTSVEASLSSATSTSSTARTTSTVPISGTSTVLISGTSTVPISGTSIVPISGTSTVPISGTSTVPISGTSTVTSMTSNVALTSSTPETTSASAIAQATTNARTITPSSITSTTRNSPASSPTSPTSTSFSSSAGKSSVTSTSDSSTTTDTQNTSRALTIGLGVGIPLFLILLAPILFLLVRRRRHAHADSLYFAFANPTHNDTAAAEDEKTWRGSSYAHANLEPTLPVLKEPAKAVERAAKNETVAMNPFITPAETASAGNAPIELPTFSVTDADADNANTGVIEGIAQWNSGVGRPWIPKCRSFNRVAPVADAGNRVHAQDEGTYDLMGGRGNDGRGRGQGMVQNRFSVPRRPVGGGG